MTVEIRFRRSPGAEDIPLPAYATAGAAGFDLRADVPADAPVVIAPAGRALIGTGFAIAIPDGYEMQIRPRSGLALRFGVTVANAPATIDSDYRGTVGVILANLGAEPFAVARGDRIAQGVVAPVTRVSFTETDQLDKTARGSGGFGSTGRG